MKIWHVNYDSNKLVMYRSVHYDMLVIFNLVILVNICDRSEKRCSLIICSHMTWNLRITYCDMHSGWFFHGLLLRLFSWILKFWSYLHISSYKDWCRTHRFIFLLWPNLWYSYYAIELVLKRTFVIIFCWHN